MSKEIDFINAITKILPKSSLQLNRPFESDAEILDFNGTKLLLNVDEFSKEDMFRDHNPYVLGWNIAIGGISDILATGALPHFYAHSMVIEDGWDKEYVENFSRGVGFRYSPGDRKPAKIRFSARDAGQTSPTKAC